MLTARYHHDTRTTWRCASARLALINDFIYQPNTGCYAVKTAVFLTLIDDFEVEVERKSYLLRWENL